MKLKTMFTCDQCGKKLKAREITVKDNPSLIFISVLEKHKAWCKPKTKKPQKELAS